jgi:DNA-binding response OmpR family regulator
MDEDKIRVMVIEDESILLDAICRKLEAVGFKAIPCLTASAALEYLMGNNILPDAIWLDYYLGDMNGLDFMNRLKANSTWSQIPVIVVSNSASMEKQSAMLEIGVKRYLLKAEYRLEDIINILKEYIKKDITS